MQRAALVCLLLLTGCFQPNPVTGKSELSFYSDEEEVALGAQAAPGMEQESGGLYKDPELEAYVDAVGQRLAKSSDRPTIPFHYRILNTEDANAFALPGGFVYISRGLLASLEDESQMAACLGHETGHVAARHGVHHLQYSQITSVLLNVGAQVAGRGSDEAAIAAGRGLKVAQTVTALASLKYSRDDERQADHLGIDYAGRAGWDPRGMIGLMKVLQKGEKTQPNALQAMLRTHPLTTERVENAQAETSDLPPENLKGKTISTPEFQRQVARLREAEKAYQHHRKSKELAGQGKLQEAVQEEDEAIRLAPRQAPFHAGRAALKLRLNVPAEALSSAHQAEALDPGLYEAALVSGAASLQAGDTGSARASLTRASRLWPGHPAAPYYLGALCEKEGRRDAAAECYAAALQAEGESGTYGRPAAEALRRLRPPTAPHRRR